MGTCLLFPIKAFYSEVNNSPLPFAAIMNNIISSFCFFCILIFNDGSESYCLVVRFSFFAYFIAVSLGSK